MELPFPACIWVSCAAIWSTDTAKASTTEMPPFIREKKAAKGAAISAAAMVRFITLMVTDMIPVSSCDIPRKARLPWPCIKSPIRRPAFSILSSSPAARPVALPTPPTAFSTRA